MFLISILVARNRSPGLIWSLWSPICWIPPKNSWRHACNSPYFLYISTLPFPLWICRHDHQNFPYWIESKPIRFEIKGKVLAHNLAFEYMFVIVWNLIRWLRIWKVFHPYFPWIYQLIISFESKFFGIIQLECIHIWAYKKEKNKWLGSNLMRNLAELDLVF